MQRGGEKVITVYITDKSIIVKGHATEYHSKNGNLVCAAVSALTWNLINCLNILSEDNTVSNVESGHIEVRWEKLSDKGKLLVDSWYQGILAVNQEYGCIQIG